MNKRGLLDFKRENTDKPKIQVTEMLQEVDGVTNESTECIECEYVKIWDPQRWKVL